MRYVGQKKLVESFPVQVELGFCMIHIKIFPISWTQYAVLQKLLFPGYQKGVLKKKKKKKRCLDEMVQHCSCAENWALMLILQWQWRYWKIKLFVMLFRSWMVSVNDQYWSSRVLLLTYVSCHAPWSYGGLSSYLEQLWSSWDSTLH